MKRSLLFITLLLTMGAMAYAQETTPTGTHPSPRTHRAVRPTKKHHRGNSAKSAPGDVGRGAKAAGHDVRTGHPVEAGKSIGEGVGRGAKDVAKGTATETRKGVRATKRGTRHVGHATKRDARKLRDRIHDRDRDDTPHR